MIVTKRKISSSWRMIFIVICFALFNSCGGLGGSADTQASLPGVEIPNDDGIVISSPNAQGRVTISGNDAVPANAVVIVDVNSASSEFLRSLDKVWNGLIPEAYAQTCSSTLPECPELDEEDKCQYTSDSNGDFVFEVPASLGNSISISYLNPETCTEVELEDGYTINNNTPVLDFRPTKGTIDGQNQYLYLINSGSEDTHTDGSTEILLFDMENRITETTYDTQSGGVLLDVAFFRDTGGNGFLFYSKENQSKIIEYRDSASGSPDQANSSRELLTADQNQLGNLKYLMIGEFNNSTAPACTPIDSQDSTSAFSYNRIFWLNRMSGMLMFHEFISGNTSDADADYKTADNSGLILKSIPITFNDDSGASITDYLFLNISASTFEAVVEVESSNFTGARYYYFNKPLSSTEICSSPLTMALSDGLNLTDITGEVTGSVFAETFYKSEDSISYLNVTVFFKNATQKDYYMIRGDADSFNRILVDPNTGDLTTNTHNMNDGSFIEQDDFIEGLMSDLDGDIISYNSINPEGTQLSEVFVLTDTGKIAFVSAETGIPSLTDSRYDPLSRPDTEDPQAVMYDPINHQILIFEIFATTGDAPVQNSMIHFMELSDGS